MNELFLVIQQSMERLIILDTETTGIKTADDHRIIEIAALEMIDRQLTGAHFHEYFFPEREVDEGAAKVHGLTTEALKDKPKFIERVDEFLRFIEGATLIIHNAAFDEGFLNHELGKLDPQQYHPIRHYSAVRCTLEVARKIYPGGRNSLDALCQRFNIDLSQRELHGALIDCDLLAQVYIQLTSGQKGLFQTESPLKKMQMVARPDLLLPTHLPVASASPSEQDAHQQYMKSLQSHIQPAWDQH